MERGEEGNRSYRIFGYVRVSTKEQNEARQLAAMQNQGVPKKNIYVDKQSGKDFQRPQYARLMAAVRPGDIVIVKSIDRFGRNYSEILEQWRILTREKRADVVVLDMPLLDTRKGKDLTGTLISDIVLQLLSYVAQTERNFIRQRQREGIEAAKKRNVKFGRPACVKPDSYEQIYTQWKENRITASRAAELLGVSRSTFAKWIQQTISPERQGDS